MRRHRRLKGVLDNFLGTYTSRYSDYDGYWLFGMLLREPELLEIDLLAAGALAIDDAPLAKAQQLASVKFAEQIEKAGVPIASIREARLIIEVLPAITNGLVNCQMRPGHDVHFVARAISDSGKSYEGLKVVFVAPHDPNLEARSARTP